MEYERSSDGGNGNGQGRLIIDEEKLAILKSFFTSRNMDSTKKQNLAVIKECANQTMLTEQQVKHWISNYRAKTSGRISGKVGKSRLMRKRSGFNVFASENLFKESSGSSSNAFKNIGDKWRTLSDEQKDTFRRKALESDKDVCLPSNNAKAKKIINNMMKEVQELEALGGHCLLICGFEGHVFHGSTDVGNKMLNDSENDLVHHFANLLQCSQDGKENISVKAIQELFNKKYGEVVKKKNGKMPYSKIQEYGIAFIGLPAHLEIDIGTTPRKPALYGSAQRRELWQSRNAWSLTITSSSNLISNAHTDAGHSALQSISDPVVSNCKFNASTSNPPTSTALHSTFLSTPSTSHPLTSSPAVSSSPSSSSSLPTPSTSNPRISIASVNVPNSSSSVSKPSAFNPLTSSCLTSTSSPLLSDTSNVSLPVNSSPVMAVSSPATLASLQEIHKTKAIRVPKDMLFGLMAKNSNDVQAIAVVSGQTRVHGRNVGVGNVVVEIRRIIQPGLLPFCPGAFDTDECVVVGAFYEWPCNRLALLHAQ